MTAPTSAPPSMMPSAQERAYNVLLDIQEAEPLTEGGDEDEKIIMEAIDDAYHDGWNAALAAQPPAPTKEEVMLCTYNRHYTCNSAADCRENGCRFTRKSKSPPQPGDVERAIEAWREAMRELYGKVPSSLYYAVHDAFKVVADQFDAAQSALAASQAEVSRLKARFYQADRERLRYRDWLAERDDEIARLRAPAATGEDQEAASRLWYSKLAVTEPRTVHGRIDDVAAALAAARTQGVREERELWMDCAILGATMEGPKLQNWNRSMLDRLYRSALAAPETKEEKHDGP